MTTWRDRISQVIEREPWDLHTARLDLLPITREHAAVLSPVLADPEIYQFTGGSPPSLEVLTRGLVRWESRRSPDGSELWLNWLVRIRASGAAAGYVQTTIAAGEDEAALAWVLGVSAQGRGYATEAARGVLEWLLGHGATRFRACIKPAHVASQRVAERLGLTRSGRWIDGEEVWFLETAAPQPVDI